MDFVPGEDTTLELFQGVLDLDGVEVYPDSTVREINRGLGKLGKIRQMHCISEINICSTAVVMGGRRIFIGVTTNDEKYNGVIYGLQISNPDGEPVPVDKQP
jgi:hypothetical protein